MKEIKIRIPEYNNGVELHWEDGFKIETSAYEGITIEANREGLISLARHLLFLAQDEVPNGSHFHLDEFIFLEAGSVELIVSKKENV